MQVVEEDNSILTIKVSGYNSEMDNRVVKIRRIRIGLAGSRYEWYENSVSYYEMMIERSPWERVTSSKMVDDYDVEYSGKVMVVGRGLTRSEFYKKILEFVLMIDRKMKLEAL